MPSFWSLSRSGDGCSTVLLTWIPSPASLSMLLPLLSPILCTCLGLLSLLLAMEMPGGSLGGGADTDFWTDMPGGSLGAPCPDILPQLL